jgi:hypothetical protein
MRQLTAEAAREVATGGAYLVLDEMKIVQQPLRGWRHAALFFSAKRLIVVVSQDFFVGRQPGKKKVRPFTNGDSMTLRHGLRIPFERINA